MWNKNLQKCHLFIIYKFTNPLLTTLQLGRLGSSVARLWICKFVINNKQMAFLQIFVSQPILFLFSKDTMSNVTDCGIGRTDLWQKWDENDDLKIDSSSIWRLSVAQYLGMFLEATKRVEFLRPQDTPHLFFIPCLPH